MTICPCCNRPIEGEEVPPPNIEAFAGGNLNYEIVRFLRENYPTPVRSHELAKHVYAGKVHDTKYQQASLGVLICKLRKVLPKRTGWTISKSQKIGYKLERANGN